MSQENVELVRRTVELFREGRIDAWFQMLDPHIAWDISAHPLPDFPDTGSGRDAFARHMGAYVGGWNDYEFSIKELIDGGPYVVLVLHERTRVRGSDTMIERDLAQVLTVRNGRGVWFRVFKTRAEALEAAGLGG
jgi:ketosteroid isomerase-like protein